MKGRVNLCCVGCVRIKVNLSSQKQHADEWCDDHVNVLVSMSRS